ncbi:MAG TPA: helix-turn-helix domain-containing protein, partial [Epsilonproteobacteria bacterium]|nr:helix-turn-helix domain-containing protein [Campylobacterota bacterium]
HYFLDYEHIPECLQNAWVIQNHKNNAEAIEAFLTAPVDGQQLQELKTASSLVEAPNLDNTPKEEDLVKMFKKIKDIKKRNSTIVKAYKEGYSQHRIAKVLGMAQSTIHGIIKRYG